MIQTFVNRFLIHRYYSRYFSLVFDCNVCDDLFHLNMAPKLHVGNPLQEVLAYFELLYCSSLRFKPHLFVRQFIPHNHVADLSKFANKLLNYIMAERWNPNCLSLLIRYICLFSTATKFVFFNQVSHSQVLYYLFNTRRKISYSNLQINEFSKWQGL